MTLLTLDWFSRSMRYPALNFMGLKTEYYECEALDCEKRNTYVAMAETAEAMIEARARVAGDSLYDQATRTETTSPVVWLKDRRIGTVTTRLVEDVPITYSPVADPNGMATLAFAIDNVPVCEEFLSATVVWPACACRRLGVEWCRTLVTKTDVPVVPPATVVSLQDWAVELDARSYNFLALDTADIPDDLHATVDVQIATFNPTRAQAVVTSYGCAHTSTDQCDASCYAETLCDACVQSSVDMGLLSVADPNCTCIGQCYGFRYDVFKAGSWLPHWSEAVISLMNTMLPLNFCACEALTNERWAADRGESDRYAKEGISMFWNPFGIPMPGALKAWSIVEPVIGGPRAFSM